jgi:hypothetical protein
LRDRLPDVLADMRLAFVDANGNSTGYAQKKRRFRYANRRAVAAPAQQPPALPSRKAARLGWCVPPLDFGVVKPFQPNPLAARRAALPDAVHP